MLPSCLENSNDVLTKIDAEVWMMLWKLLKMMLLIEAQRHLALDAACCAPSSLPRRSRLENLNGR